MVLPSISAGDVFNTNYGSAIVIEYISYKDVVIKFDNTGSIDVVRAEDLRKGSVVDRMVPSVFGFGFIGYGRHKSNTKVYNCWTAMLKRCLSDDYQAKNKTYIGCSVCDEWANFQVFADWYYDNIPTKLIGKRMELDKDILVSGNKVYSPSTCKIVSTKENMREVGNRVSAREYYVITPNGENIKIYNMRRFCRDNNLDHSCMTKVNNGTQSVHKGYRKGSSKAIVDKTDYRKGE